MVGRGRGGGGPGRRRADGKKGGVLVKGLGERGLMRRGEERCEGGKDEVP